MQVFFRLLSLLLILAATNGAAQILEDFESNGLQERWRFSNGLEFPGAKGNFSRSRDAAHQSDFGGKLSFDFNNGGRYVSAIITPPKAMPADCNALQVWVKRLEGHGLQFRYTDARGQTFQKPVECSAGRWEKLIIPFVGWTGHWGGPNDGKLEGPPQSLALLVEDGEQSTGELLFDDLRWVRYEVKTARVTYPAYRFAEDEGWSMRATGNPGASRLVGNVWKLDFSKGARALSLTVADRVLLGNVEKLRLRFASSSEGRAPASPESANSESSTPRYNVRFLLRTHFMNFHKTITNYSGDCDLVIDAPPGEGWQWYGGENDGKIHGPLRLAAIEVNPAPSHEQQKGQYELRLQDVLVETSCPSDKRCVLLAEARSGGGGPKFTASVRALTESPLSGKLLWVLRDWEHNQVGNGSKAVTIPPLAELAHFDVPIDPAQIEEKRFLEAEFQLEIDGQKIPAATAVWLAESDKNGDSKLEPSSPFGMGLYLNRYSGDAAGLALMESAAQMARDAGVKWSREDFSWARIEPRRGEFNWEYYDNLIACAKRNGITVYAIVGYWSGWTQPYTEQGIQDYVRFLRELVKRYGGDIKQWEIWNEPNIFFWQGPKDLYADLLRRSYAAVKELDPQAQVLGLSTAGIDTDYINRMLELKAPFDILTIHPYRKQLNDVGFIKDLRAVSDLVRLPDQTRRPVWLTEMGWATHTPHNTVAQDFAPNSQRAQAELITRSYLCSIVSGVEPRTFWYNFRNDGEDPIYFEHQMGIVHHDFRPKAAYLTYATLTSMLGGLRLEGPLPVPDGVLGFRFRGGTGQFRDVAVAWSPSTDTKVQLPVAGKLLRINAVGETTELTPFEGKVDVVLKRGAPVYLVSSSSAQ